MRLFFALCWHISTALSKELFIRSLVVTVVSATTVAFLTDVAEVLDVIFIELKMVADKDFINETDDSLLLSIC